MTLQAYLFVHRSRLLAIVQSIVVSFENEEDDAESRRRLTYSTYKALRSALEQLLNTEDAPATYYGFHDGVAVSIFRPEIGKDLFGSFAVSAGLLGTGGMVPCPEGWPNTAGAIPPFTRGFFDSIWASQGDSRVVKVSKHGTVRVGAELTSRKYILDMLPGDEMWLRPAEAPCQDF